MRRLALALVASSALLLCHPHSARADGVVGVAACGVNKVPLGLGSVLTVDSNTGNQCQDAAGGGTATVSATPATVVSSAALAANLVVKASAGKLFTFEVAADSTLSAAAWWIMIYNATTAPADGAVTPAKCYAMPLGSTALGGTFGAGGDTYTTGIVIGVSTTGCFTKTESIHAFISGDEQ